MKDKEVLPEIPPMFITQALKWHVFGPFINQEDGFSVFPIIWQHILFPSHFKAFSVLRYLTLLKDHN